MFGVTSPLSHSLSWTPQAANPWARFAHPMPTRAGPSVRASRIRPRYASRVPALRRAMRRVTSATTGCTAIETRSRPGGPSRSPRYRDIGKPDKLTYEVFLTKVAHLRQLDVPKSVVLDWPDGTPRHPSVHERRHAAPDPRERRRHPRRAGAAHGTVPPRRGGPRRRPHRPRTRRRALRRALHRRAAPGPPGVQRRRRDRPRRQPRPVPRPARRLRPRRRGPRPRRRTPGRDDPRQDDPPPPRPVDVAPGVVRDRPRHRARRGTGRPRRRGA